MALLAMLLMFVLMLAACSKDAETGKDDETTKVEDPKEEEKEEDVVATDDGPQKGGTITGAMYSAPTGMFNPIFYEEAYEANILDFTHEGLFSQNANLEYEGNIAKDWSLNDDQTELTIKLEEGVKWHDGVEFTAHDVVFTYQTIADPDYVKAGGVRTSYAASLKGYEAYNKGETDVYEGVVAEDDYTVVFYFAEPAVTPLYSANFTPIPKHIFENMSVLEIPESEESLQPGKVIGNGPFKFAEMIEREQYVLEGFADYWKGEPYLDKIVWKVVEQSIMTGLLEKGELDFLAKPSGIQPADYEIVKDIADLTIIEQVDFGYQILGFKHNHRTTADVDGGIIEPANWVPNKKITPKSSTSHCLFY